MEWHITVLFAVTELGRTNTGRINTAHGVGQRWMVIPMYDELIETLRETSIDFGESDHISVMMIEAANAIENTSKAYQMMAEAYEAEVTKHLWIPVTERLPEICRIASLILFTIGMLLFLMFTGDAK